MKLSFSTLGCPDWSLDQVLTCAHVVAAALGLPEDAPETPQAKVHLDFPLIAPAHILTARVIHWQLESDVAGLELDGDPPVGARPVRLVIALQGAVLAPADVVRRKSDRFPRFVAR